MIIVLLGLVAALGFWFLVGLALYVIVGGARREMDRGRVENRAAAVQMFQAELKAHIDRYALYERRLPPTPPS